MSQGDPEICHTLSNIFMNLGTPVCPGHYLIKQRPIIFYVLGILSLRYSLENNLKDLFDKVAQIQNYLTKYSGKWSYKLNAEQIRAVLTESCWL